MFFWRDKEPAHHTVDAVWKASRQSQNYLGEWHTHPENDPTPSSTDIKIWKKIVRQAIYEWEGLFFVIVGKKSTNAWELRRGSDEPLHLNLVES